MFDGSLAEIEELAALDDATLIDTVRGWARAEAAAAARKLAVMAELFIRRTDTPTAEDRDLWWVDPCAAVCAELGAAQGISQWAALAQTRTAVALRDRLPKVAALLAAGLIDAALAGAIVWRTHLIEDPEAMARVDAALAAQITGWGARSAAKMIRDIDALVVEHDPGALRKSAAAARTRFLDIGGLGDEPGTMGVSGRLSAHDGERVDARLAEMANSVCPQDARSRDERRIDAMAARVLGDDWGCRCGRDDCPATPAAASTKNLVVHIIAEPATIDAATTPEPDSTDTVENPAETVEEPAPVHERPGVDCTVVMDDSAPGDEPASGSEPSAVHESGAAENADTANQPAPAKCTVAPAVIVGGGVLTDRQLAELLPQAVVRTLHHPGDTPPEPGYVPSRALADFIRCRDMTCRFPGCDKPAYHCDIDHTVPYPYGCTHASNLKCLCRFHHLLKTFWTGPDGWSDAQLPDGTLIWRSPTGHQYTTYPGSTLLIPALVKPTGTLILPDTIPPGVGDRAAMMPKRHHTRAHDTTQRITAERKLNDALITEQNLPPPF